MTAIKHEFYLEKVCHEGEIMIKGWYKSLTLEIGKRKEKGGLKTYINMSRLFDKTWQGGDWWCFSRQFESVEKHFGKNVNDFNKCSKRSFTFPFVKINSSGKVP